MKQRIVWAGLIALALWPLLHIALVRSTGISPWRGFGWGMYTVPVLNVSVSVRPLEGGPGQTTPEGKKVVVETMKRYMKRYQALGRIARPDDVARSVFTAYPRFQSIEINVSQNRLDRKTARIVPGRRDQFRYQREGGLQETD